MTNPPENRSPQQLEPEIKLTASSFGTLGYTEPHTLEGTLAFLTSAAPIPTTSIPATAIPATAVQATAIPATAVQVTAIPAISAAAAALSATSSTEDMLAAELLQRVKTTGQTSPLTTLVVTRLQRGVAKCGATSGAGVFADDQAGAREPAFPGLAGAQNHFTAPPGEAGARTLSPLTADPSAAPASAAAFEGAAAAEYAV